MIICEVEGVGFSLNLGDLHAYPVKHSRIERILQIKLRSQLDPLEHNTQAPNTRINLFFRAAETHHLFPANATSTEWEAAISGGSVAL